jgi:hypothetical protein
VSEASDNLEARLNRLRLRPVSAGLEQRIAANLGEDPAGKPGDRWLWSAIISGATAACVVVAILISDARSGIRAEPLPVESHLGQTSSSGPALASAAQSWGDELGPGMNRSHP